MSTDTQLDHHYMRRALSLAERGSGLVSPNPLVGCVLVRDKEIVGEGWHHAAGLPHAEVEALRVAAGKTTGATAYVTLEPCHHHGRTPPCSEALLVAGITEVVYALADPNPVAAGGGAWLASKGVRVRTGILEAEAAKQNRFFLSAQRRARPWVMVKSAHSLDGRVATRLGHSQWITGTQAREAGHELRQMVDAILVGAGTVVADDPSLTVRLSTERLPASDVRHPLPIVVDRDANRTLDSRLLTADDRPALLVTAIGALAGDARLALENRGHGIVELEKTTQGRLDFARLLEVLHRRGVQSLLVEGGPGMHGAFIDQGLVDECALYIAPMIIGGDMARPCFGGDGADTLDHAARLHRTHCERRGEDWYLNGLSDSGLALLGAH